MATVILLLGHTYSYKSYIMEHCMHNPALNCTTIHCIKAGCRNIAVGNMNDYNNLDGNHTVLPVYIDTPADEVIKAGLKAVKDEKWTYTALCEKFLAETKEYDEKVLERIKAHIINATNAVDACYEFIKYLKETS